MVVPLSTKLLKSQWRLFANTHPMAKGVMSYAVIWPTGCLIQQTIEGKNYKTYDWMRCLRFSIFGALYVAPTLYGWVRLSSVMWPQMNLKVGVVKGSTMWRYGQMVGFPGGMREICGPNAVECDEMSHLEKPICMDKCAAFRFFRPKRCI